MEKLSIWVVVLGAIGSWLWSGSVFATTPLVNYGLDSVPRVVAAKGKIRCPAVDLVRYRGERIRYHKPVRVYREFRDRLYKFEQIVEEVATEVYGRAPKRIRHLGTYNCRRIRKWPTFLSEHGLGNAIDIEGFEFGPAPRDGDKDRSTPKRLRRSFRVELEKHWGVKKGPSAIHGRFLDTLAKRLVARHDIFRVLLGPAYPGHKNHFHFDCSPWRLVDIWE